ncbi:phage tail length tape measure family protein [Citrobacter amalonaticus]|uniref:phage tail length tape measure family protein n=1 Tax=Citrobacter amalonaticus TaxID=35703 RepID=UPI001F321715|nr:phage tail length tape measure family protein [Citrobacter amalonaticus]
MSEQTSRLAIIIDSTGAEKNAESLTSALHGLTEWGQKAAASAGKVTKATEEESAALSELLDRIDPVNAALNKLDKQQQLLAKFKSKGMLDDETFDVYSKKIEEARNRLAGFSEQLKNTGMSAKQTAFAMRMLPAQMTDIVVGLSTGQSPFMVLMQQGGQLKDMFGGIGPAIKGVGSYVMGLINPFTLAAAAVGVLGVAYYKGTQEQDEFNKSLILTGNQVGKTSGQLADIAARAGVAANSTTGKAASALNLLVESGKVAGDSLERVTTAVVKTSEATGIATDKLVGDFNKIAADPLDAITKLNDQYHFLTLSTYNQIKALQDEGNQQEAARVATDTYANTMQQRATDIQQNLGLLEKAWNGLAGAAKGAWDAMLNVGRESGGAGRIAERRYTINGEFDLSENKVSILEGMLAACAGDVTYIAGKHGLLVGAYYGPATEVITESQLAGDIEIMPEVSQSERVNTIKGTFVDPQQGFTEADFPSVSVSEWVAEDVVEISQDMKLRFVTSEFQAQRLADVKLKRTRIARTMNVTLNLSGYRYRPGMYVKVNFPSIGIVNVEMRVTDWKFGVQNGVQLTLKQETADVWGDAVGKPIERPPFTQLPSGGVAQPQNMKYTVEEIGQVVQGILSWENIGQVVYNKVVIRRNGQMVLSAQVPGSFTRLTGLPRNTYMAHVSAVNQMGAESPEAYLEFSVEAPPPPSHVDIEQGFFAVTMIPRLAAITNVSTQFDFWTSGGTQLSGTSTEIVEGNANREGMGTTWTSNQLQIGHTYYWYIRTINAFGASAFIEVPALCSMDTGSLIDLIDDSVQNSEAFQNIKGGVDTNLEGIMENALANHGTVQRQFEQYGEVKAEVMTVKTTIANLDGAFAELADYVQAQIGPDGELMAAVNQKLTAEVKSDGTAKASYTLDLGIVRNGVKYNTGFGMSIEPSGSTYKSTVVFAADQFGIYSGSDPNNWQAAFFVYNGQVFIRSVLIQEASIDFGKITDSLQSANFVAGVRGWNLPKNASPEFHGKLYATSGEFAFNGVNNTVVINGNGITVNLSGGGRVVVGKW